MLINIGFYNIAEGVRDRNAQRSVYQLAPFDDVELGHVGKIGTVYSSEFLFRKSFFQMLEVAQGGYVLHSFQMEEDVILQAFYEENLIERYAYIFIIALHDQELVAFDRIVFVVLHVGVENLLAGVHEVRIADRLQQIVESVNLVGFDGILLEGCSEDDLDVLRYHLGEFQSTDLLHVDGQEQDVEMTVA